MHVADPTNTLALRPLDLFNRLVLQASCLPGPKPGLDLTNRCSLSAVPMLGIHPNCPLPTFPLGPRCQHLTDFMDFPPTAAPRLSPDSKLSKGFPCHPD